MWEDRKFNSYSRQNTKRKDEKNWGSSNKSLVPCSFKNSSHLAQFFSVKFHYNRGSVAQWITRLTTDQEIPGSTPGRFDKFYFLSNRIFWRAFASNYVQLQCKKKVDKYIDVFNSKILFFFLHFMERSASGNLQFLSYHIHSSRNHSNNFNVIFW